MGLKLAIVGATGLVGNELLSIVAEVRPDISALGLYASSASVGKSLFALGNEAPVESLASCTFSDYDAALFCVGDELSNQYVPAALDAGCAVVDKSNAFRLKPDVPLVVPGVNDRALTSASKLVANPNCTTIILSHALGPIKEAFGLKQVFAATYQSVSGAGRSGIQRLNGELISAGFGADVNRQPPTDIARIAHNIHPCIGALDELGRCSEEAKLVEESRKILATPQLAFVAHTVRVPVAVGHGIALTFQLDSSAARHEIVATLQLNPDIRFLDSELPSPLSCSAHDQVEVGRLRQEPALDNGWSMFICGDNLRIGAAVNGWRILELMAQAGIVPEFVNDQGASNG